MGVADHWDRAHGEGELTRNPSGPNLPLMNRRLAEHGSRPPVPRFCG